MSTTQQPTLCVIHEGIGRDNAIAKLAMLQVRTALDAGWHVSVVAKFLDESLRDRVSWLRLYVPPRSFFIQWTTARRFIRRALGNRTFDVIHAHQPQVADLSDVFHCHFLTRVAHERKCLEERTGLRAKIVRLQQQGVLHAEDRCYRRWNPNTRMIFVSTLMQQEFHRLYCQPPLEQVLPNPCPPWRSISDDDRRAARVKLLGDLNGDNPNRLVVGYLGGLHKRKGYKRLIPAIEADPNLFLLMGGAYCENFSAPALAGRCRALGLVDDISTFYAACDCIAVPSLFEPQGMVAFEAAAHGVPVIATNEVGALGHLLECGAGIAWQPGTPLGPLVRQLTADPAAAGRNTKKLTDDLSESHYRLHLLSIYDQVLQTKAHLPKSHSPLPARALRA